MVDKFRAIEIIIERGKAIIGDEKMDTILKESGIELEGDKIHIDNIDRSYSTLTHKFAGVAPTAKISLMALSKIYDFELELKNYSKKKV